MCVAEAQSSGALVALSFPQALQIRMLTSHFVNGAIPLSLVLVKVSESACVLLNGKFTVCTEQLEHAVHFMAVYLG